MPRETGAALLGGLNVSVQNGNGRIVVHWEHRFIVGVRLLLLLVAGILQWRLFRSTVYIPLTGDMVHYNYGADMLLKAHMFAYWGPQPTTQVTPGYPLFLAACKWLAGFTPLHGQEGLRFVVLVQGLLTAIVSVVVFEIGRRLTRPVWAAIGALLWTLYLPAITSSTKILTESLYVFLLCIFVLLVLEAMDKRRRRWWLCAGLALGACTLVRPTPFPLVAAALVYFWIEVRKQRETLRSVLVKYGLYAAGFLVFLIPWWIRNWLDFHRIVLTSDDLGNPLLFGSYPDWESRGDIAYGLTATQQKQLAIHHIVQWFTTQPLAFLKWYTVDKLVEMFGRPWYGSGAHLQWWVDLHVLWVLLGVLGFVVCASSSRVRWVGLIVLYFVIVQLAFIPLPRYVYPVMPFLFIGVGMLGQRIWCRWVRRA
jgi:4-amino-4-deoxy-L-arabinose transferase-like glycosyltransferase